MRYAAVVISFALSCVVTSDAWAQNCKPTMSRQDKISKQQIDVWAQELWSTSFLSSVVNTSESSIRGTIGRYGAFNAINLEIQKKEESATNAAFDAAYRGAKGATFYLGFANGQPVALVVTDVSNAANVRQGLLGAKGVTTVVLSATVSDREMARLREQFTTQPIDAIRIRLSGDMQIDKSVSAGDGRKMMEKFRCFYELLDKRAINLTAAASSPQPVLGDSTVDLATVAGKYVNRDDADDYFQLAPDGTAVSTLSGALKYAVRGTVLTFQAPEGKAFQLKDGRLAKAIEGSLTGNTYVSSEGSTYERVASAPPQSAAMQLTVEQIVKMVEAKIPDEVILASLAKAGAKYDLTPEDWIRLKGAGASDAVLRALAK